MASVLVLGIGLVAGAVLTGLVMLWRARAAVPAAPPPIDDHGLTLEASAELARLRVAFDALPIGVVVANAAGTVIQRNATGASLAGSTHASVLLAAAIDGVILQTRRHGRGSQTLELYGPPRHVLVIHGARIADGSGNCLVTVEDQTERLRLDAVRTDFVANVSHELKTPVGAMTVLAETLVEADDPEVVDRLAGRIVAEAERLSNTVDDLLELSRIELGGDAIEDPVEVRELMTAAVERVRSLADRRGITVAVVDGPTLIAKGDRRQLASALGNIVENAVKYSDRSSSVEVHATAEPGWVVLGVTDHGIGIPSRDIERVFERFYRVDRARSRETGGTGLGLSIARHVAVNHGGTVTVRSVEGEGSTFELRIPAMRANGAPAARGSN